jgi:hypothetical protein
MHSIHWCHEYWKNEQLTTTSSEHAIEKALSSRIE